MSEITIDLDDDVAERLAELDDQRVEDLMNEGLARALNTAHDAESRREELKERMGVGSRDSEELTDDSPDGPENAVERKQAELRRRITEGR